MQDAYLLKTGGNRQLLSVALRIGTEFAGGMCLGASVDDCIEVSAWLRSLADISIVARGT